MSNRIHSLRKEKRMRENLVNRGVSSIFGDFNITVNVTDDEDTKYIKFVRAIKRNFKKKLLAASSIEEKTKVLNVFVNGPYTIEFEEIGDDENYIKRLLHACIRDRNDVAIPVRIKYNKGEESRIGYGFLNHEIPGNYHNTKRKLRSEVNKDYETIYDIFSLVASVSAHNVLVEFAIKNREYLRYLQAVNISNLSMYHNVNLEPGNPDLREDVMKLIKEHQLPLPSDHGFHELREPSDDVISLESFYLEEDKFGNLPYMHKIRKFILHAFLEVTTGIKYKTNHEFESERSYAAAFQEKKNISLKTREVMENNAFLTRYGEVELDNETDLIKFKVLEKDFIDLCNDIYIPKALDHSFRVRKLGKHRAAGLYFPFRKATVFDLDHPSSYCHELAHQIDYTHGNNGLLSEEYNFLPVYEAFKLVVSTAVVKLSDDDPFKVAWSSKNKYNADYYLQNTEVFARCYELYLFHVLRLRSSLLKDSYESAIYPKDESLLRRIEDYFSSILSHFESENKKESEQAFLLNVSHVSDAEQLVLF